MLHSIFKPEKLAQKVLFLDFDGTIALPEVDKDGNYVVQQDGHIDATHLNKEQFAHLVQVAIKNDIPLYFVSGRSNIQRSFDLLNRFIEDVNGFHSGIGGFKKDSLYFISRMVIEDGKLVNKSITTKAQIIQDIHKEKYKHLSCDAFLFVDDVEYYLDPVKNLGYGTVLANPEDLKHFDAAELFMTTSMEQKLEYQNHSF